MWENFKIVRDAEHYWLACTPDAEQFDGEKGLGLLQIKTTSEYKKEDWADGPPIKFQIQLQHELRVTGHQWGTLVVLIGGQKLRYYDCDRNDRFINAMIPKLKEFWDLVQSNTPPSVDGSLATANVLARLHPDDNGLTCMLPTEAVEWCATITDCRKQINELKALSQEAENKLVAAIGDNTFGVLSDGSKWSNKKQDRRGYYVNPTSYRVLRSVK
jgi:predicted phage-related endonuclease